MSKKNVIDKRKIKLEDIKRPDYIGFGEGRPNRITIIGKDDITNLSILLHTTNSIDELLNKL